MGIYITDMEMPKVCVDGDWYGNCPMSRLWCALRFAPEGYTMEQVEKDQQGKLPSWCPLNELLPHGRLIDADAFNRNIANIGMKYDPFMAAGVIAFVNDAPTIIPADLEGGADG